jgi:hypothetical protein
VEDMNNRKAVVERENVSSTSSSTACCGCKIYNPEDWLFFLRKALHCPITMRVFAERRLLPSREKKEEVFNLFFKCVQGLQGARI